MTHQCLSGRHLGDLDASRAAIVAGATDVNVRQRGVDWRLTIDDARRKLKSVCPRISF